jgi:type IV pilus assembly protein PilO
MILGVLDDFLERPPAQKIGLIVGVIVLAGYLDWQMFYGARIETLQDLRSQVSQLHADLEVREAKTAKNARTAAEQELKDLSAELKRAQARLPDQREIADLLSNVAASGRAAGLEILLFKPKAEVYRDFYAEVPVEMQMRGTYHDVALFLDSVKRLDRIVNVTDIQLKKPRVENEKLMLDASCTAATFRFLDEAERQRIKEEKKKDPGKPA